MLDGLLSLLSEEWVVMYIAFRMLHYLPLLMAMLFLYFHIRKDVKVQKQYLNNQSQHENAHVVMRDAPLLKWRRFALPKRSDEPHCP